MFIAIILCNVITLLKIGAENEHCNERQTARDGAVGLFGRRKNNGPKPHFEQSGREKSCRDCERYERDQY